MPSRLRAGRPYSSRSERGVTVFETEPRRTKPRRRIPLKEVDLERERSDFRHGFADRIAREKAAVLPDVCQEWRPDAIVCDDADFGSMIAAERLGLPHATVVVTAARSFATAGSSPSRSTRSAQSTACRPILGSRRSRAISCSSRSR